MLSAIQSARSEDGGLLSRRGAAATLPLVGLILLAGNTIGAALAVLWIFFWRIDLRDVGFVRPRSWWRSMTFGVLAGVALKLLMKAVVMPLLGAPAANPAYHNLTGNRAALPGMLLLVVVGGGFGEELMWRGLLFHHLRLIAGTTARAQVGIVALTSLLFGLAHYYDQGFAGAEQSIITGLAFGSVFAMTRSIWAIMAAHASYDVVAVALIFSGREAELAHTLFR